MIFLPLSLELRLYACAATPRVLFYKFFCNYKVHEKQMTLLIKYTGAMRNVAADIDKAY